MKPSATPNLQNVSDCPRTEDAILVGSNTLNEGEYVRASFARQLERALNAQIAAYNNLKEHFGVSEAIKPMKHADPRSTMLAHQYLYYVKSRPIWSDYEYDQFCTRNKLDGSGGSDLAKSYDNAVIELANQIMANPHLYRPT